ncbi:MAG: hypothetical protein LBB24_03510 [Rickettsiales bacterium]|nr:hypothetical protein [Rickettsiales bacterium]
MDDEKTYMFGVMIKREVFPDYRLGLSTRDQKRLLVIMGKNLHSSKSGSTTHTNGILSHLGQSGWHIGQLIFTNNNASPIPANLEI